MHGKVIGEMESRGAAPHALRKVAGLLQQKGRNGDTMLAHITPQEAALLEQLGGAGTRNPETGLLEFFPVDVDGHTRQGYDVKSHTRSSPRSSGGSISQTEVSKATGFRLPVPNARIRGKDDWGDGRYGASRTNSDNTVRKHKGLNIVATPGETVVSPINGTYVRPARPYADDPRFSGIVIKGDDGSEVKVLYVDPAQNLKPGDPVIAGKTPIGTSQDITKKYPASKTKKAITNHVHIQIKKDGQFIDPSASFDGPK